MKQKIEEILKIYEEKHIDFYFKHSKEEMNKYMDELLSKNEMSNTYDLLYIVKLVLKYMLNDLDLHTKINYMDYKLCGMNFKFINDDLYVIRTVDEYNKYKYLKLESINDIPIQNIFKQIGDMTISPSQNHLKKEIENYFNYSLLKYLPIFKNIDRLKFNFENGNTVEYDSSKEYNSYFKKGDNYHYDIYDDTIVFRYLACMEPREGFMVETINKIKNDIEEKEINNFIVDLRYNEGGNSEIINPLIDFIKENNFNLITLIDKYVFSSGIIAIGELKNINSILIGETPGSTINHFGENKSISSTLDGVDYRINISTKYFYIDENGEHESVMSAEELEKLNSKYFSKTYYEPDIYIEDNIEYYKDNRDVYMEQAFEIINQNKNNIKM